MGFSTLENLAFRALQRWYKHKMAHISFGAGVLIDESFQVYPTLMGFPSALYAEFDSVLLVADAIPVDILDAVQWFWNVRSWSVVFGAVLNGLGYADQEFVSTAADEIEVGTAAWEFQGALDSGLQFSPRIVITPSTGEYGVSADIEDDFSTVVELISGTASELTFSDGSNTVTATASEYWPYT